MLKFNIRPNKQREISPEGGRLFKLEKIEVAGPEDKDFRVHVSIETDGIDTHLVTLFPSNNSRLFDLFIDLPFTIHNNGPKKTVSVTGVMLPPDFVEYDSTADGEA